MPGGRQQVRVFWTGPELSLYERLSLASFVRAGADVQLFTYDRDLGVPEGVERIDANEILPGSVHGFRGPGGDVSFALHSNLFRYVALETFGGWYADLDIVFIGKALPDVSFYVARETAVSVNAAVLKCPAAHPLMTAALGEARRLLPQTSASTGLETRFLIGPALITRLVKDLSLESAVQPRSSAYEIGHEEVGAFFDPASCERLQERLAGSDFIHLWNQVWRWIRIPKEYGPPEGSYLDVLFSRAGIRIPARGRLSYSAMSDWFREYNLVEYCKHWLRVDRISTDAIDRVGASIKSSGGHSGLVRPAAPVRTAVAPPAAANPQTIQTFWAGGDISPYRLLSLRSFVDRGHKVDLFTYDAHLRLPSWIVRRNAKEILPRDQILLPSREGVSLDIDLFRYALLHALGGWWVDPDIVLLQPDLPNDEVFFAGLNGFGRTSTSLLRFPKGHEVVAAGLSSARARRDTPRGADEGPAPHLAELIRNSEAKALLDTREILGPVSWFEVAALFDPARTADLERRCASALVLQLHFDVWRRSGIPQRLGPPKGSLLERLFERHDVSASFTENMTCGEIKRWTENMYGARAHRRRTS